MGEKQIQKFVKNKFGAESRRMWIGVLKINEKYVFDNGKSVTSFR